VPHFTRMDTDRDWLACAERLHRDAAEGSPLVPASRLKALAGVRDASAVTRWILRGKRGVYLDGVRSAGKGWLTTAAALARFQAALSAREAGAAPPAESPAGRERRAARAVAELRRMGVPV
jgi:hypothetical protein